VLWVDRLQRLTKADSLQSGAGKTTLLDVISQRKTSGLVEGSFTINGQALDSSFSRKAGFCMQADIHDAFAT
jgi:ABC-type multidrug transport system ATPase subunit